MGMLSFSVGMRAHMTKFIWLALLSCVLTACLESGGDSDTTPPFIVGYSPSPDTHSIDHETAVDVVFDEAINHASVNGTTFTLRRAADNAPVAGSYQFADEYYLYKGTLARFVPAAPLDGDTVYTVSVTTGIADLAGNHLAAPVSWSFTTAPTGGGTWSPVSLNGAPTTSAGHTAVWTGSEMLVWGGVTATSGGYRYDPVADTWKPMSSVDAPSPRSGHSAVWTGKEMIVWGGQVGSSYTWLNDGARYDPETDTWHRLAGGNAPEARAGHSAVWSGSRMLIWGGRNGDFAPAYPAAGGLYDPATDTWTTMSTAGAPLGRAGQTAVWTGEKMVIWGGIHTEIPNDYPLYSGGRYDPASNTWLATTVTNAPAARSSHTAIWSGSRMIVWGGFGDQPYFASGARYDPATDAWEPTGSTDAPLPRWGHSAVWTGSRMLVWGGYTGMSDLLYPRQGGRYDPVGDGWLPTATLNSPVGRTNHTAVWTGTQMIVWGGLNGTSLGTGGIYTP